MGGVDVRKSEEPDSLLLSYVHRVTPLYGQVPTGGVSQSVARRLERKSAQKLASFSIIDEQCSNYTRRRDAKIIHIPSHRLLRRKYFKPWHICTQLKDLIYTGPGANHCSSARRTEYTLQKTVDQDIYNPNRRIQNRCNKISPSRPVVYLYTPAIKSASSSEGRSTRKIIYLAAYTEGGPRHARRPFGGAQQRRIAATRPTAGRWGSSTDCTAQQ